MMPFRQRALALALALAALPALPVCAQTAVSWTATQVEMNYSPGIGCQPKVSQVSGTAGSRALTLQVSNPVEGSITASFEVTLQQGQEAFNFNGGQNLRRGSGPTTVRGDPVPSLLPGMRILIRVTYCQVYAPAAPPRPPSG